MIGPMPELAFVAPGDGADPAAGLLAALREEVGREDAAARLDPAPPELRPDRVFVVLAGGEEARALAAPQLARTVAILLAPPGGAEFEREAEVARRAGAAFHVNAAATERLLELGIPARHLQLGFAAGWGEGGGAAEPELAVLRDRGGYLDWPALLAATRDGAVVLHERALGLAPLVAGRHLFVGDPAALGELAAALRRDPERLRRVQAEATEFLRTALPLALAAAALTGAARALVAQPLAAASGSTPGQPLSSAK